MSAPSSQGCGCFRCANLWMQRGVGQLHGYRRVAAPGSAARTGSRRGSRTALPPRLRKRGRTNVLVCVSRPLSRRHRCQLGAAREARKHGRWCVRAMVRACGDGSGWRGPDERNRGCEPWRTAHGTTPTEKEGQVSAHCQSRLQRPQRAPQAWVPGGVPTYRGVH